MGEGAGRIDVEHLLPDREVSGHRIQDQLVGAGATGALIPQAT